MQKTLTRRFDAPMIDRNTIYFLAVFMLWFVAFLPVYPELISTWLGHSDNSHGILVPVISGYFIFAKRKALSSIPTTPSGAGAVGLIISLILYLMGYAGGIAVIARLMIVTSLICLILYCYGTTCIKELAFPLLFLFFMVPVPDSVLGTVSFPMQLFATKVATAIIHGLAIPVYREGNMVYLAQTQLEVAEACSGIRSLVSYTMLSAIFAYMMCGGWKRRAVLLAAAVPLALIANIGRVTATGILAHFIGAKAALGFLHESSGLLIFILGFVLLFYLYYLLNRKHTGDICTAGNS